MVAAPTEAESPRRVALVRPPGRGAESFVRAARSLARACGASLSVYDSAADVLALRGPPPVLVVKERQPSRGGTRARPDEADRRLCAGLPCPTLLYSGDLTRPGTVLAAVALRTELSSDVDRSVVLWAATLARWRAAPLHVVHAWSSIGETIVTCPTRGGGAREAARWFVRVRRNRTRRLESLLESCGLSPDVPRTLGRGLPSRTIRVVASHTRADLLVIGHRARSWIGRLPHQPIEAAWSTPCMSLLAIDIERAPTDPLATTRSVAA